MKNLAIIGKAGAGKTTAAEHLVREHGYTRLSFATPLKIMLGTEIDRHRLQEFGTDVVRAYEPDAWVRLFLHEYERHQEQYASALMSSTPPVVVDDARFLNEVEALQAAGFEVVRVVTPKTQRVDRLMRNGKLAHTSQLDHASETSLDTFEADHRVINDRWYDDLTRAVEGIARG